MYSNFKKVPPDIEKKLDKIFYNVGGEGGLGSVSYLNKTYPYFKKYWKPYLQSKNSYNITLGSRKRFKRLKYIAAKLNFNFQADIAYMTKLNEYDLPPHNNNVKYLLVIQDILSRFIYVYPLKTKSSSEVCLKFEHFYKTIPNISLQIFTDRGSEFKGKTSNFFKKNNIQHYFGQNDLIKASMAERAIRNLKQLIWRYVEYTKNLKYIDTLPKIVQTMNSNVHSRLGFAPNEITSAHVPYIFEKLHTFTPPEIPKFMVNDTVHVSKITNFLGVKETFSKFSNEIFLVNKIHMTSPITLSLKDFEGEDIIGRFYENELTFANISSNTEHPFIVLKENKNNVYVHFTNFSKTYDRWISKRSITSLKKDI